MSWKFWKKQAPPPQTFDDFQWPNTAGASLALLVGMFMQRLAPFSNWKSPDAKLPAELDALLACSAWGFQLSLWFVMLTSNHGEAAADVTREAFLKMLAAANPELEAEARSLLAFSYEGMRAFSEQNQTINVGGQELEMPMAYFLAVFFLTKTRSSPYYNKPDADDLGELTLEFAKCLDHANQAAIKVFVPMHKALSSFSTDDFPRFEQAQ